MQRDNQAQTLNEYPSFDKLHQLRPPNISSRTVSTTMELNRWKPIPDTKFSENQKLSKNFKLDMISEMYSKTK